MRKFYFLLLGCLVLCSNTGFSQPIISFTATITGLSAPVEVVNAGDGTARLFVVQQNGIIRVVDPSAGGLQATPFLDISSLVTFSGEQGLLSMAFHPAYETNGYFFVYYNNTAGSIEVARYQATGTSNTANAGSGVVLLTISKPMPVVNFANHNGGHLQFASDGTLFFATGDGGNSNDPQNKAQDSTSLLGKMIRLNVDNFSTSPYYTVPANNPFVGTPNFDNRIWARGLRNPFRWSFDRLTGDMWIGDVGQGAKEEVSFAPGNSTGGENWGWRCYEGSIRTPGITPCDVPGYVPPVFDYNNPGTGPSSVVGGYVYRGTEYPVLQGWYIAADVYSDSLYLLRRNAGTGAIAISRQRATIDFIVGFGEAENGDLYAVSQSAGIVYKVNVSGVLPVSLTAFAVRKTAAGNEARWTTTQEEAATRFYIEYSLDGVRFTSIGETRGRSVSGGDYTYIHPVKAQATVYYRLRIADGTKTTYSAIVKVDGDANGLQVYPTIIKDGRLYITANTALQRVQVLNNKGAVVLDKQYGVATGQFAIDLPAVAKGMYLVRLIAEGQMTTTKVLVE